jgi:DNA-binding XRE family transcriptional regulator
MQNIKDEYIVRFMQQVQFLVAQRKEQNFTQNDMAVMLGVSLKTIQNFENYRCFDGFLIFG